MSLYSALNIGVQGLRANSSALSGISNNIANLNTVGFKRTRNDFSSIVSAETNRVLNAGGGVTVAGHRLINEQGSIQGASSNTDLAISGSGFFAVTKNVNPTSATPDLLYTRAGAFTPDADGNLQNAAGYYLQGWPAQADGTFVTNPTDTTALQTVNINAIKGVAEATTEVSLNGNLKASQEVSSQAATYDSTVSANNMASGAVTPDFVRTGQIYDSQGGVRHFEMAYLKDATAPNTWHVELYALPASDVTTGAGLVDGQLATGTVVFNADGTMDTGSSTFPGSITLGASAAAAPGAGEVKWATGEGIDAQTINFDLSGADGNGGLTQYDSASVLESSHVNGSPYGSLIGVSVDQDGFMSANFSNGLTKKIYQLPMANFVNPNGLVAVDGDAYRQSEASGALNLKDVASSSSSISSQALEGSNVDLAKEFTDLISVQRAYSASSKIITTADEMLDELIRVKR